MEQKTKTVWLCNNCYGNDVHTKMWINANTNEVMGMVSDGEDDDNWCSYCEQHTGMHRVNYPEDLELKVLGFQVVNEFGYAVADYDYMGKNNPEYTLLSLSEALNIISINDECRLRTIYDHEVMKEDFHFTFKGDPITN